MAKEYIFRSERLGFRNWSSEDLTEFSKLNADPEVMEHFPKKLSEKETGEFLLRLQEYFSRHGYTYYATEILDSEEFIGFIGLAFQDFEAVFNPSVDIGWRLKRSSWGNGYATEGAKRCLNYAFNELQMKRIISICPEGNYRSQQVMKKIGMTKKGIFKHPALKDFPEYEKCVWYELINR